MMKKFQIICLSLVLFLVGCGTTDSLEEQQTIDRNDQAKEVVEIKDDDVVKDKDIGEDSKGQEDKDSDLEVNELEEEADEDQVSDQPSEPILNAVSGEFVVHFIDVGQADATLLQTDDITILFDAGNWNRRDVVDYLLSIGVKKIDLLIGSHPDADHIGQMALIIDQFQVHEVWMSGVESTSQTFDRTITKVIENEINYHEPRAGESYELGNLVLDVISPSQLTNDSNEDSISINFTFGDTNLILTGDAGVRSESQMINQIGNKGADILHVGHHGSTTSTSQQFLNKVDPEYAIISAGVDNSYGHPHDEVVERLLSHGIEIFATYQHGTIIFASNGSHFKLRTTIAAPFVPDTTEVSSNSGQTALAKPDPVPEPKPDPIPEPKPDPIPEPKPDPIPEPKPDPIPEPKPDPKPQNSGCINVNNASFEELMGIKHIGEDRAQQIVDLRESRQFDSVEDLSRVKGIGPARIKDIVEENNACVR